MDLPTIPLLSRVQPLPTVYGTNNVINDTAELLTRVLACELLPHDTPTIVIYDSTVVHSQRLVLFGTSYTNRQRTRTYFPAIIWMLAQRLKATNVRANPPSLPLNNDQKTFVNDTITTMESVIAQIKKITPCGKTWILSKHLTLTHNIVYIKIKSHQLRPNGQPKYHASPHPCLALVHGNHWADRTCELPHTDNQTYPFLLRFTSTRITSPLYILPTNMYYSLYLVDTDVSVFTACPYNAEIIIHPATTPDMGWYTRNMSEFQSLNRTIGFMSTTRRLITHQATSWTQKLYKDTNTRRDAQSSTIRAPVHLLLRPPLPIQ